MPSKLPKKLPAQAAEGAARRDSRQTLHRKGGIVHHEVRIEGKLNGFWGAFAAIVFLLLLGVVFVLGLATITVLLWIACGAILLAMISAFFRMFTGTSRRRPPPDSRP